MSFFEKLSLNNALKKLTGSEETTPSTTIVRSAQPANIKGLSNPNGSQNCFLNVVIQILWHCEPFRQVFNSINISEHVHSSHDGDEEMTVDSDDSSCVFCALKKLFTQYQFSESTVLIPEEIRLSLSRLYKNQSKFQLSQMDDASEAFQALLSQLNSSLKFSQIPVFDLNVSEQVICYKCGFTGEPLVYTCSCWYLSVAELLSMHNQNKKLSFEQVIKTISQGEWKQCETEKCGKCKVKKFVLDVPSVICLGLTWENDNVLASVQKQLTSFIKYKDLRIQEMFHGVATDLRADLISLIGYYGRHYITILKEKNSGCWFLVDDAKYRNLGDESGMIGTVISWRLQISAMFFQVSGNEKSGLILKTASPTPKIFSPKKTSCRQVSLNFDDIQLEERSNPFETSPEPNTISLLDFFSVQATESFSAIVESSGLIQFTCTDAGRSWSCQVDNEHVPRSDLLDRNLQVCVVRNRSSSTSPKQVTIYLKFYDTKISEEGNDGLLPFAVLPSNSSSCFLSIPACLHKFQSFHIICSTENDSTS